MIPQHVVMSNMDKIYTHTENLVYRKALRDPPVEIAPNLFVSCYPAVCNLRLLRNLGITHVVNAASGVCRSPFQRTGELQYLNLDLADSTDQNVADAIVFATDFLREALAHGNNNKVVIHCQAGSFSLLYREQKTHCSLFSIQKKGISRSVTLCISWMIQHHRLTLRDALNSIRRFRPIANPNEYFIMQLEQLEQAVLNEQT